MMTDTESSYIDLEASRSWASLPEPPEGLTKGEVIRILLASNNYDMNPSTFAWSGSNDATYHSLWVMCQKLSVRGGLIAKLTPLMMGRSSQGYTHSRGMNTSGPVTRGDLLRNDVSVSRMLESAGICITEDYYNVVNTDVSVELVSESYVEQCVEMHIIKRCQDSIDF